MVCVNRVTLYTKLTNSEDDTCTLFEDILRNYFEEYGHIYNAINHSGLINNINDIECVNITEDCFEINVTFNKSVKDIDINVPELESYLKSQITKKCSVNVNRGNKKNTLLINITKEG